MIDINKVTGRPVDRSTIIHSSGIGKVANGQAFGASSPEAYSTRRYVEANRRHIGSYNNADLHTDNRSAVRPFSSGARSDVTPLRGATQRPVRPQRGAFHEPPKRTHNPYM